MSDPRELPSNESRSLRGWRWVLLTLIVALYLGVGVFDHELWPPGEQAMAGVTWSMLHDGDVAVPKIDGMPYLEKPPLAYVMSMLSCKLGSSSAGFLRLPSALFGLASLALVFWTCRRKFGEHAAWTATLVCATTYSLFEIAHRASTDSAATFAAILCLALFVRDLDVEPRTSPTTRRRWRDDLAFCIALAASFYVKNFYTFLVVVPPVAVFLLVRRDVRRLIAIGIMTAVALAILVAPWCWALYERGGSEYLRVVFVDNTIGRFFRVSESATLGLSRLNDAYRVHKDVSVLSLVLDMPLITLPWTPLYAGALVHTFRRRRTSDLGLFTVIACITIFVAVSLSASKVYEYLIPILFVIALATAGFSSDVFAAADRAHSWLRGVFSANIVLVLGVLALAPAAAARLIAEPALAWIALPTSIALGWMLWSSRGRWRTSAFTLTSLGFVSGAFSLVLWLAIPRIDATRSWRPFFDLIERDVAGRELFTSFCDDRRLPAMNWYLDRSLTTLDAPEDAFALLGSARHVAVILPVDFYAAQKPRFDAIPHRAVRAPSGKDLFVLVTNP